MAQATDHMLFANLAVRDLPSSMAFFEGLGFAFNPRFTDENAACVIVNDGCCVMLLSEPFFKGFTDLEVCDTRTHTEALMAVSCPSRNAVDDMTESALSSGGRQAREAQDLGFMYSRSFYDLDGHHWEAIWMSPEVVESGRPA